MNFNRYIATVIFSVLSFLFVASVSADRVFYNAPGEQIIEAEYRVLSKKYDEKFIKAKLRWPDPPWKDQSKITKKQPKPKTTHKRETVRVKEGKITKDSAVPKKVIRKVQQDQIIGSWDVPGVGHDNFGAGVIKIYRRGGKVYHEQFFNDGSVRTLDVIVRNTRRGMRFDPNPPSGDGEHYIINRYGNLEVRDDLGLVRTGKKSR